jgi:hypothetical protein
MSYKLNREKIEVRKQLPNTWRTTLSYSFSAAPFYCCFTVLCPFCAAYQQRERALYGNWSQYLCCAGMMPCSGRLAERNCPQFCLLLEVCCCFSVAVQTTRALIQDELQLRNAPCDNFIIGFMVMLQYLDCVCDIVAMLVDVEEISQANVVLDQISQWCYCLVCSCLQTQQHVELNTRDSVFGIQTAPNVQHMTRN